MNLINYDYKGSQISFEKGKDVMVNLTSMAKAYPEKNLSTIVNSQEIKEYINALTEIKNFSSADLLIVRKGGDVSQQGTWAHRLVAIRVAQKLNPALAVWVDMRIDELMRFGVTATPQTIDNILADPDNAIKILTALKEERKKNKLLEDQNHVYQSEHRRLVRLQHEQVELLEVQAPKVEYADNILNSATTYTTTQIAKELGLSAQHLNFTLKSHDVIEKKGGIWTATETYVGKGYLTVKSYPYRGSSTRERTNFGTVWTEAGRMFIHSLIAKGTLPFK